jgi:branched-chain amino acid transport system substrate-binding protein
MINYVIHSLSKVVACKRGMALLFTLFLASISQVNAQDKQSDDKIIRVGVVAPDEGSLGILGTQLRAGFLIYQNEFIEQGLRFDVIEETEICETGGGADTAYALEEAQVDLVVGFLCVESLVSAIPILDQADIPVLNVNIRSDIVRDEAARLAWPLFTIAPRASDQAKFASKYIIDNWGDKSVALVEDGTISNRELVDAIRLQLDDGGFQPIVLDNFRPGQDKQFGLVRRLEKSKISHVFVGATRLDTSIIARDASDIGLDLIFAGGDTLRAADEGLSFPNGAIAILPHVGLTGDNALSARTAFDDAGIFPDRFPIFGYAMAELATILAEIQTDDLIKTLKEDIFDTVIGPLSFNQYGERQESTFNAMIWQDGRFIKDEELAIIETQ